MATRRTERVADALDRHARALLWLTIVGVGVYVATWLVLGAVAPSYDPLRDAISELFAIGAPVAQRWTLTAVLVLTGIALLPVGFVLDRVLPGTGRSGAWLTTVAGVGTVLVGLFPCTAGCPGFGTTLTDSLHVVTAGGGYIGLVTAPLAWARRLRTTDERRLATAGLVLGLIATVGFVVRNVTGLDALGGLQQRVFNTAADLWFVVAAWRGLARLARGRSGDRVGDDRGDRDPAQDDAAVNPSA